MVSFINHVVNFMGILTPYPLRGHFYYIRLIAIWLPSITPSPSTVHVIYGCPHVQVSVIIVVSRKDRQIPAPYGKNGKVIDAI